MKIQLCDVADYVSIDELKFYEENPRSISRDRLDQLKESIKNKGFYQPILVWHSKSKRHKNTVLAGNHRLIAVKELLEEGYEFNHGNLKNVLPVVFERVSEEQARAILFDSNNVYANWIEDKLRSALKDADSKKIASYGFTQDYVDSLLGGAIKEANKVVSELESERIIEPVDAARLADALEEDRHGILVLDKDVYDRLIEVIKPLAKKINPKWRVEHGVSEALSILIDKIKESGIIKELLKDKEREDFEIEEEGLDFDIEEDDL